ncbi:MULTISPECIES: type II toxin-antitoxin system YafQ family toxin [Pasteurellaceae]|uniref:Type II toxin-antitoxin system YafQ family toxin n=1 Tax=Pasteurella atlantica TaxID=2827233 RepID=A0AAW8CSP2_9PAST|nr:type II toxin-antitoxin system YafQ family toxin [Pasteurella atlantica]MBR0574496.1 type II toxin-antitoxin system YafQ family toxin [Pasteurella atlantica]MDP8040365.1 type II toxin-antitoxin system YafQ family toxin [Pasteurella atlantica]MDP8042416.1 type II toxin-antitoxin system YafQ family toxin [Pasteurella atlantica]MDP8044635.1 type II toxin-antitoxin system YafQ family toxin [Pasteurella atlantica]MDP8046682.1 type II toxin-antitoxin system YafQ family toxin [Pasteurella atlantic
MKNKLRILKPSNQFKRDLKKYLTETISSDYLVVMSCLLKDEIIPEKYRDHALTGDLKGCRDCHIKPDLVLIYRDTGERIELLRLGSHSELF